MTKPTPKKEFVCPGCRGVFWLPEGITPSACPYLWQWKCPGAAENRKWPSTKGAEASR